MKNLKSISVFYPCLNDGRSLPYLLDKTYKVLPKITQNYEVIVIDDGSTDNSFHILQDLSYRDTRIKIIRFSRNFGSHAACLAGLINSKGDACVFISADLQEPPELILSLIKQWENGHEVVIGMREGEESSSRIFQKIYYFLVRKFALKNMPAKGTDVFLIDRKVVNAIVDMREKNTSIFGLILWSGFNQIFVPYRREARQKGVSKWSLEKKIKLFIDTFVSFSYFPMRFMSFIGIMATFAGLIYATVIIINKLFFLKGVEGWSYLMVVLLVVSGIQLLMLGILGEYLWRNLEASRNRPVFIIDKLVRFDKDK